MVDTVGEELTINPHIVPEQDSFKADKLFFAEKFPASGSVLFALDPPV